MDGANNLSIAKCLLAAGLLWLAFLAQAWAVEAVEPTALALKNPVTKTALEPSLLYSCPGYRVDDLDAIAGKANDALDIVGLIVPRQLEDDDVAAVGGRSQNAAGENVGAERHRVIRIAVGVFRHENIIADQQRRDHRARRNIERLKEQRADDKRDRQRLKDDLDGFENPALFAFFSHRNVPAQADSLLMHWGGVGPPGRPA